MTVDAFGVQARLVGVELSRRARTLLSPRALNALVRDGLIHGGDEWIATWLPRRFQRSYATLLGYVTSQRKSRVYRNSSDGGLTYDEKKRKLQGHGDPLVWTGRLRAMALAQARTVATATRGTARGRITFGRLYVGNASSGYSAPPPIVVATLLGGPARRLPAAEVATVRAGFLSYLTATLDGVTAPTKKPVPAPGVMADRRTERQAQRGENVAQAERERAAIGGRLRDRRARTADRWESWRQDSGGSAALGQSAMTPAERLARHRSQSRASYLRRRHIINPRRRMRRRLN